MSICTGWIWYVFSHGRHSVIWLDLWLNVSFRFGCGCGLNSSHLLSKIAYGASSFHCYAVRFYLLRSIFSNVNLFRLQFTTFAEFKGLKVNLLDFTFSRGRYWDKSVAVFPRYQYSQCCRRPPYCIGVVLRASPISDGFPKVGSISFSRIMTPHNFLRSEATINKLVRNHPRANLHDGRT